MQSRKISMLASGLKVVSPLIAVALLGLHLGGALAQTPGETVSWTVAAQAPVNAKPGDKLSITVRGDVLASWHVYGREQLPSGPIPLKVTVDQNEVASADRALAIDAPVKFHDPSFNLETQYYEKDFQLTVPVRVAANAAPGAQQIPVSVRFQTCNGKICKPPKTVKLLAPVNVRAGG
jgi:thiol:disulfide interchange protein DsbD